MDAEQCAIDFLRIPEDDEQGDDMNALDICDVKLCCEYVRKSDFSNISEQGQKSLNPTPLSLLVRTFGACGGAPWFNEGVAIDAHIWRELGASVPSVINVDTHQCRLQVFGNGRGRLDPDKSLVWGLTGYESIGAAPRVMRLFDRREKAELLLLFKRHRLRRSCPPYKPLVRRIDEDWIDDFLLPIGVSSQSWSGPGVVFFDRWFNASE